MTLRNKPQELRQKTVPIVGRHLHDPHILSAADLARERSPRSLEDAQDRQRRIEAGHDGIVKGHGPFLEKTDLVHDDGVNTILQGLPQKRRPQAVKGRRESLESSVGAPGDQR